MTIKKQEKTEYSEKTLQPKREIADQVGVSQQRVAQIIQEKTVITEKTCKPKRERKSLAKKVPPQLIFSCPDWNTRLSKRQFPLDVDKFLKDMNQERANKAVEIFQRLRLPDVPGTPAMTEEVVGTWTLNILRLLAGATWLMDDGRIVSQVSSALISIPKKNSKSSYSAGFMLTLMMMSIRPNATFVIVAPTQRIAQLAYDQACGFIRATPGLERRFHIQQHLKKITFEGNKCTLSVISLDSNTITGIKASCVLIDEGWLMGSENDQRVMTQLRGAAAAITESMVLIISTMSDKPASGFWKQELALARAVRDGKSAIEGLLPLIWEPDPKDMKRIEDVCLPEVWERCNPNIGRSVNLDFLKRSFKSVMSTGNNDEILRWLSQHTNAEISQFETSADSQWPGAASWANCADEKVSWDWILKNCTRVAFGFDGGGAIDLTSAAVLGYIPDDDTLYVATKSWCYQSLIDTYPNEGVIQDGVKDGHIKVIEPGEEVEELTQILLEYYDLNAYGFMGLAVDPAGIAQELHNALTHAGLPADKVVSVKQGFGLRAGWLHLYRRAKSGKLKHPGDAVLSWAVANARQDPMTQLVAKKYSTSGSKIDPIVAVATGAMLALNPPAEFSLDAFIG